MRRSSLPNVKDNLVVTRSNIRYSHSPNVSRSWESRDFGARARAEERLARAVGDRGQERKVLEWCKRHNVNVIRKLPKLDSTILASKGVDTEKFVNFVDEAKIAERETHAKPTDYSKERTPSAEHREKFCGYCQRELPKRRRKCQTRKFRQTPYECEHCGASNDIYEDSEQNGSESEDEATRTETVRDTIRRGNSEQVIDHRTFSEHEEKSENVSKTSHVDTENDESDIFWRSESDFDGFQGKLEEQMSDMNLNEGDYGGTVVLTETTLGNHGNRPVEIKMAWDDDSTNQFAEISRTIATDDGIEAESVSPRESYDVVSQDKHSEKSDNSAKSNSNSENLETANLLPENDSRRRLSPTPPSYSRRGSSPRNFRYGGHHRRNSSGEVHITTLDSEKDSDNMTRSPIANRSVGLSRVALMRLSRESRARTRGSKSTPETSRPAVRKEELGSHLLDSYAFLDAVSPEIESIHRNRPGSS